MATLSIARRPEDCRARWEDVHAIVKPQIRADGLHEWPFLPSFPIDVRHFEFGKTRSVRRTRHAYFELLYVHSGEAAYEIQGREFNVGPTDLIVVNGDCFHRLADVQTAPFRAIALFFLPDILRTSDQSDEYVQYLMPFLIQNSQFPHVVSQTTGLPVEIRDLMLRINAILPHHGERERLQIKTYLKMILVQLLNHYRDNISVADAFDRRERVLCRMRPLFDYVETHYQTPITLSEASRVVAMSKPHFMRSFKRLTGQSFDTYLNHFRIAKAQVLLETTDLPISEVGHDVGFSDQSYFGLVFRRLVHQSPREYRKSVLAE